MMSRAELVTPSLLLTEGDTGTFQEVAQLDLDEAFKTLSIHKTISGNQAVQISTMKMKSDAYARGILSVNVTNFQAGTILFTIWLSQLNYPLVATALRKGGCKQIQFKVINDSLSKCGFSQKLSRTIVFGSVWFGGLGWRHLYFEQDIIHVLLLLINLRTPGPFHSLLLVCLEWYQVLSGVSFCPLYMPTIPLNYLDSAWLDSTFRFLQHCSAQLLIPAIPLPAMKRQHDACTMDGILDLNLSAYTMKQINYCRLWLRVTTLTPTSKGTPLTGNPGSVLHPCPL
jgi:hypothetical protein